MAGWRKILTASMNNTTSDVSTMWSGNTYGTRCGVVGNNYIGNHNLGSSPDETDFTADILDVSYYPYFRVQKGCKIVTIGGCGNTNYASNGWAASFWLVDFDHNDGDADTVTQIGHDFAWAAGIQEMGNFEEDLGTPVSAADGNIIIHSVRATSGSTNKYFYFNPSITYFMER
tara:strand:+ start:7966 stop:8484 length:519 start_codon:yes stop_codon:yes gene_type:complete